MRVSSVSCSSISSNWSLRRSTWYRYVCFSLSSWAVLIIAFLYLSSSSVTSFCKVKVTQGQACPRSRSYRIRTHFYVLADAEKFYIFDVLMQDCISGYGLVPAWHQAATWTNGDLLSTETVGTNRIEILFPIIDLSYMDNHLKMPSAKWWPMYSGYGITKPQCGNGSEPTDPFNVKVINTLKFIMFWNKQKDKFSHFFFFFVTLHTDIIIPITNYVIHVHHYSQLF